VLISDEVGVNSDAREAVSFAILAWATANGIPGNVPGATGARKAVVLGKTVWGG
jgi:anhydro-N-acetylmuramic acid kinase